MSDLEIMELKDLPHLDGGKMELDCDFVDTDHFWRDVIFDIMEQLDVKYDCGKLTTATKKKLRDDETFFRFEVTGDPYGHTNVFLEVYETEEKIYVEWKYEPISVSKYDTMDVTTIYQENEGPYLTIPPELFEELQKNRKPE